MKKVLILSIVALSVFVAGFAFAAVTGSVHDLETAMGVPLCQACHHPHTGIGYSSNKLWNINGGQDDTAYTTYGNGATTMDSSSGFASWACMSCHDGTISANVLYKGANSAVTVSNDLTADGFELRNDHPVDVTIPGTGDYDATPTLLGAYLDASSKVQCSTCHDVHNGTSASTNGKLLRATQTSSGICKDCHTK